MANGAPKPRTTSGRLIGPLSNGARFRFEVPTHWNGTLLLYSPGATTDADELPPVAGSAELEAWLLNQGHALVASTYYRPEFWPLEDAFVSQIEALDAFERELERPTRTIAWGYSIGGPISAGLIQRFPDRFSGALPLCGSLAGAVATRNVNLDSAFVFKSLLAPDSPLELVDITDPERNLELALSILHQAQATSEGRARIALAAAMSNVPGWLDGQAEPEPDDHVGHEVAQYGWFERILCVLYFQLRAGLETRAGGNGSWNTGVDYRAQLDRATHRVGVRALYAMAALDLEADLRVLEETQRIEADAAALEYLTRNIVFDGDLGGTPVLTLHTTDDGLVIAESEQAYADVVRSTGQSDLLRQVYVRRAGHCNFTLGETAVALGALISRVDSGVWPGLAPDSLNVAARDVDPAIPSAFAPFTPAPFPRPYDARHGS